MIRGLLRSSCVCGLAASFLLTLVSMSPALAETIGSVGIRGNVRAEDALIFSTMGLEAGSEYSPETVRAGIRNLYRQGLFRDVRVLAEPGEGGLALTIEVAENPTILRIRYGGADKLDEDDFAEVVELVAGQTLTARRLNGAIRDILALYEEKGYLLAQVKPEVRGTERVDVIFRVQEGQKVQVEEILFIGNDHVASGDLRGAMETQEDRWWRGGDFRKEIFRQDKERIVERMGASGYADARIVDVRKAYDETRERLTLEIEVEEGPLYRVGEVSLDHGGVFPEDRVRLGVLLKEGEPFNTLLYDQTVGNLYSLCHEEGHIYAKVEDRKTRREGHRMDVDLRVEEGEPARIHRVLVSGNTRTRERVIRREMVVAPGDVFRRSQVLRSQREIFQLGFFDDLQLDSQVADPATGDIDLILEVQERQTGQATMGMGVNSQTGLTGFLQLAQNNWMGKGQLMSIRAEFGRFREFEFSFTEPWLLDTPTSAGIDVFDTKRRFETFTETRTGGDLRLGRRFPWLDYTRSFWRYSLAEYQVEARGGNEDEIGETSPSTISSMTLTLVRNSVDSPFFPTRGSSTRLVNEFAGGVLGGDESYHQLQFGTKSYFRTVGKFVLSLSGDVGFLNGLKAPDQVPFWRRYRLGGIARYGLRGYPDYDVVPDPGLPSTGGRCMLTSTAELRYPIVQSIQGLVFLDAGNTWNRPGEMDLTDLRRGVGAGVRIDVPMVGQLGFDYAYGFDRDETMGGPGWEFHFQIGGQAF
ncbi:MAG: outer membrane protein assembly factor BamA [Gemmatimonadota bacterium]|nr:outer membrane protein assembly factor BamA [Gemmatimonadota bacterium]MDP7032437.1 outer membrane protein assembly factor BamA [Gemmatimonadota bacterium]